jgi:putative hemolysin
MLTEILIVVALILLNGVLALSELAIVSARPARLRPLEHRSRGARAALRLGENPGRFLSTVQIGITLVGVLSGAFSGATLGARLAGFLAAKGVDPELAQTLGVGGVVVLLTYLSLIVGELVPKQLALRNPEAVAMRMAPAMVILSKVGAPIVWLLDISGRAILFLLGVREDGKARVTEEEVKSILSEAHDEGVLESEERDMISGVMRLADRSARALMTPRTEILFLDSEAPPAELMADIRRIARPRMPVRKAGSDEVLGIVTLADAFQAVSRRQPLVMAELLREVPVVSDLADALDVMEVLRGSEHHLALVYDEYGHFEGIITSGDILEAITGTVGQSFADEPGLVEREDGSFLVAGWMPADEFCDRFHMSRPSGGDYETVAGLVLHHLGRMPALGDKLTVEGLSFEVIDMDDRRIDKLLVGR